MRISINKTLRTVYGDYEFMVVTFGLTNDPIMFMCVTNNVLHPHLDAFIVVFVDDILVYSKTKEEHQENFAAIL